MPGVRLKHRTAHSGLLTVETPRPYPTPYECGRCFRIHPFKTFHLDLDSYGYAYVSLEVWAVLQSLPDSAGFLLQNEVKTPPTQGVGFGSPERTLDDRPLSPALAGAFLLGGN